MKPLSEAIARCQEADALLITAGAGMGVDSGLPDFRSNEGFWNAYPPYRRLGMSFIEMACPDRFVREPEIGWGFYGHRLDLYRSAVPHAGFSMVKAFGETLAKGCFVFTSNVDGHFQRAGFAADHLVECHGSIHHLQCFEKCQDEIWAADGLEIEVDPVTMKLLSPLPKCPHCSGLARPNILMFGDWDWNQARTAAQVQRLAQWQESLADSRVVILEFGAGTGVPTVRNFSERTATAVNGTLIRVNPREPEIPGDQGISLPLGALAGIEALL